MSYNFADLNLPELNPGSAGTYGWHVLAMSVKPGSARKYDGHGVVRSFRSLSGGDGMANGPLSFTLLPALFRATDSNYKTDRNDVKFIVATASISSEPPLNCA